MENPAAHLNGLATLGFPLTALTYPDAQPPVLTRPNPRDCPELHRAGCGTTLTGAHLDLNQPAPFTSAIRLARCLSEHGSAQALLTLAEEVADVTAAIAATTRALAGPCEDTRALDAGAPALRARALLPAAAELVHTFPAALLPAAALATERLCATVETLIADVVTAWLPLLDPHPDPNAPLRYTAFLDVDGLELYPAGRHHQDHTRVAYLAGTPVAASPQRLAPDPWTVLTLPDLTTQPWWEPAARDRLLADLGPVRPGDDGSVWQTFGWIYDAGAEPADALISARAVARQPGHLNAGRTGTQRAIG